MRYSKSIAKDSVINLNADLYHRRYPDISSWDSNGILLEAIYSLTPNAGFTRPMYSLTARYETSNSNYRVADYSTSSLILSDSFRIDDIQRLSFGAVYAQRKIRTRTATLSSIFLNTDIDASENLLIYLNLKLQSEDSYSAAGGRYMMMNPGGISPASRSNKTNAFVSVGINYSVTAHHSVELSYQRDVYDLDKLNYTYNLVSFDYFYKF